MSFGVQAAIFSLEMWLIFIALSYMDARRRDGSAATFGIFVVAFVWQLVATYQFVDLLSYVRFWYPSNLANLVAFCLLVLLAGGTFFAGAFDLIENASPRRRTFRIVLRGSASIFVFATILVALVPTLVYWIVD